MVCFNTSKLVINSVCFPLHSSYDTVICQCCNWLLCSWNRYNPIQLCKPELQTRPADVGLESNLFYNTHMFCYVFWFIHYAMRQKFKIVFMHSNVKCNISIVFCFFQTLSARLWVDWSWFWGYTFIMMRSCCINIQQLKRWLYCLCWWLVLMLLICLYVVTCDWWGDVLFLARWAIASVLYELFRHP